MSVKLSPSYILDAWLVARAEYYEALARDVSSISEAALPAHMDKLDDLLDELDKAGTEVNKLFGSDIDEGEWNKVRNQLPE